VAFLPFHPPPQHPYSHQVPLLVREPDGALVPEDDADGFGRVVLYQDGSMDADLPTQQLSELFNVNHFIVSQVMRHCTYERNAKFAPMRKWSCEFCAKLRLFLTQYLYTYVSSGQPALGVFVVARFFGDFGGVEVPRSQCGCGGSALHQRPNAGVAQQRGERDGGNPGLAEVDLDAGGAADLAANLRGTRQRGYHHLSVAGRGVRGELEAFPYIFTVLVAVVDAIAFKLPSFLCGCHNHDDDDKDCK